MSANWFHQASLCVCDVCDVMCVCMMCVCDVCVSYRSLQQHCRVQSGLQLDHRLPPHLQVADVAHQPLAQAVFDSTELRGT